MGGSALRNGGDGLPNGTDLVYWRIGHSSTQVREPAGTPVGFGVGVWSWAAMHLRPLMAF
jgi:hypothetical protein